MAHLSTNMDACAASNGASSEGRRFTRTAYPVRGDAQWCFRADATCGQQSRRGLGDTDGFAFVPHTVAVFGTASVGHRDSKISPKQESGDSEPDRRIIFAESGRL